MRMIGAAALAWTVACAAESTDTGAEAGAETAVDMTWTLDPAELAFGEVPLGTEGSATTTLVNSGLSEFSIFGLQSEEETVTVSAATGTVLAPGGSVPITATWTPGSGENLRGTLQLLLSGTEGLVQVPVGLLGTAYGPAATLTIGTPDLGATALGCTLRTSVAVANEGNAPLHVTALALDGALGFSLQADDLPWEVAPGEIRTTTVEFTPYVGGEVLTALAMASDDPLHPELADQLSATGSTGTVVRDEWEVPPGENVTGLFAVNEVVNSAFRDRFEEALPTFFETLLAAGVPYRIAFTTVQLGTIAGDTAYVDESADAEEASEIVAAMVEGAAGDNDYLLDSLDHAITENLAWLIDDDENWATSKLNLVGINSDQEQSSGNYVYYVGRYQAQKSDPDDIAVHGIGGDSPMGCSGAEPFTPFSDAANATGGIFLSICETDWIPHMEALALAFLGDGQVSFPLSAAPAEWSLEVFVDGAPQVKGWTYNAASNRISFDDDAYPGEGELLRIQYYVAEECPA